VTLIESNAVEGGCAMGVALTPSGAAGGLLPGAQYEASRSNRAVIELTATLVRHSAMP